MTAGQTYYWTVKINKIDPKGILDKVEEFINPTEGIQAKSYDRLYIPRSSQSESDRFSSITFVAHDGSPFHYGNINNNFIALGDRNTKDNISTEIATSIAYGNKVAYDDVSIPFFGTDTDPSGLAIRHDSQTNKWFRVR